MAGAAAAVARSRGGRSPPGPARQVNRPAAPESPKCAAGAAAADDDLDEGPHVATSWARGDALAAADDDLYELQCLTTSWARRTRPPR